MCQPAERGMSKSCSAQITSESSNNSVSLETTTPAIRSPQDLYILVGRRKEIVGFPRRREDHLKTRIRRCDITIRTGGLPPPVPK